MILNLLLLVAHTANAIEGLANPDKDMVMKSRSNALKSQRDETWFTIVSNCYYLIRRRLNDHIV